jgi:hypothetical protein
MNEMGFWRKLFGDSGEYDQEIRRISKTLLAKAVAQSHELRINPEREADKLAAKCGVTSNSPMLRKRHHPANFMDVVFGLLCYPPELAYVIALKFSKFEHHLGFQPFGTIMTAMARIMSLYSGGMLVRATELQNNLALNELLMDKPLRAQKAGEVLARAIFISSKNFGQSVRLYRDTPFDEEVKLVLDTELTKIASRPLADAIINRK